MKIVYYNRGGDDGYLYMSIGDPHDNIKGSSTTACAVVDPVGQTAAITLCSGARNTKNWFNEGFVGEDIYTIDDRVLAKALVKTISELIKQGKLKTKARRVKK